MIRTIPRGTLKRIHINQHNIRFNGKLDPLESDEMKPVVSVKLSKENVKGYAVRIEGPSDLTYSPDKPLSCGAKVWIETRSEVKVMVKPV